MTPISENSEVYKYCFAHFFDVSKALSLIASGGLAPEKEYLNVDLWSRSLGASGWVKENDTWTYTGGWGNPLSVVDMKYVEDMPVERLSEPLLGVEVPDPDTGTSYLLLIDGHHRLMKAWIEKMTVLPVLVVTGRKEIEKFYWTPKPSLNLFNKKPRSKAKRAV